MSDLVDPSEIERIVGVKRRAFHHVARVVKAEDKIYILHSQQCLDSGIDLRDCQFSRALDAGVQPANWATAERLECPVLVEVIGNLLVPYGRADG